jgi:hypothetical protein
VGKKTEGFSQMVVETKGKYTVLKAEFKKQAQAATDAYKKGDFAGNWKALDLLSNAKTRIHGLRDRLAKETKSFEDYIKTKKLMVAINPFKGQKSLPQADEAVIKAKALIVKLDAIK